MRSTKFEMKKPPSRPTAVWRVLAAAAFVLTAAAIPAGAQKKNKDKNAPSPDAEQQVTSAMPMSDSQAIDKTIGEALGYWQLGDTDSLHKYYAEDVVLVSGAWEAPIMGWDNFLKAYKAQRENVTGARLDRSNTLIKVNGNTAWATYQFVYSAQSQGQVVQYRGHTTLCLAKQGDRWLITLNHSSIVDSTEPQASLPAASGAPGKP
jgi:ketosteroid isomerase-like protein